MKKLNVSIGHKRHEPTHNPYEPETKEVVVPKKVAPRVEKTPRKLPKFFNKRNNIILLVILIFLGIAAFAYYRITSYGVRVETFDEQGNKVDKCTNILNPECWTDAFRPQLKSTDGFTNVLVIGMDTRDNGSLMNTDTLMMISYDHKTNKTMLLSIPRDFFSFRFVTKINAVLAYTHNRDKTDPYRFLKEEFLSITGKQINYVVTVKFNGVIDLVNNIGGIEVCPYAAFTAQYPNPKGAEKGQPQWLDYPFEKGCQKVDGDRALVYARFRHIRKGPGELASDFSRARRQQEVVNAVKSKLLSDNLSLKERTENYWSILQTVDKNITFDFTFEDFLAALALIDTADKQPAQVVLDPNFGGLNKYIYSSMKDGEGYTVKSRDTNFKGIKEALSTIWANIDFYKETPNIMVRNQTGDKTLPADSAALAIKTNNKYWSNFNVINDPKTDKFTGIKIFDFTAGKKPNTLAIIQKALGVDKIELLPESYGISQSNKKEDFLIVVGPAELPASVPTTVVPTK
jgi:LCP family protein required for cell wall assembly